MRCFYIYDNSNLLEQRTIKGVAEKRGCERHQLPYEALMTFTF